MAYHNVRVKYDRPKTVRQQVVYEPSSITVTTPLRKRRRTKHKDGDGEKHIPLATSVVQREASAQSLTSPLLAESSISAGLSGVDVTLCNEEYDIPFEDNHVTQVGPAVSEENENDGLNDSEKYALFIEAVLSDQCSFLRLTEEVFVANEWNSLKDEAYMNKYRWAHIQSIRHGDGYRIGCQCSQGKRNAKCFHIQYLDEFHDVHFPSLQSSPHDARRTFLCAREETSKDGIFDSVFSVPPPPYEFSNTIKHRAFVKHHGDEKGGGTWKCSKDLGASSCYHIVQARHSLQQHIHADIEALDEGAGTGALEYSPVYLPAEQIKARTEAVSYMPLPPPLWARISTDIVNYQPPIFETSIAHANVPICLDENATCCCQSPRVTYNPFSTSFFKKCTIYGLTGAVCTTIEVQACCACKRRFIGPDCQSLGLFNFNNATLLTHELLDDYTNQYTTSETPFIAWVTVMSRRYEARNATIPFISDRLFRAAWFSYIQLVQLDQDMTCPICGPNPEAIIVDGVTLAFSRRHLRSSLRPPTTIHPSSPRRDKVKQIPGLQFIPNSTLRHAVRDVLTGPALMLSLLNGTSISSIDFNAPQELSDTSDGEAPEADIHNTTPFTTRQQRTRRKIAKTMTQRIQLIPTVITKLEEIDLSLSQVFNRCYGPTAFLTDTQCPAVYKSMFLQVVAEETCLQMINGSSLEELGYFCAAMAAQCTTGIDIKSLVSRLTCIPALYHVVDFELKSGKIQRDTIKLCLWLYVRASTVLLQLQHYPAPPLDIEPGSPVERWQDVLMSVS